MFRFSTDFCKSPQYQKVVEIRLEGAALITRTDMNCQIFLSSFNQMLRFSTDFCKSPQYQKVVEIRLEGAALIKRTDGRTLKKFNRRFSKLQERA
jgi:uncharacterized protein (DUF1330 family)